MSRTTRMPRLLAAVTLAAATLAAGAPLAAQDHAAMNVMVGTQAMYPSKDIVDNAVNSKDHTTLVAAVKAAGLVETLKTKGPFTVFAPVNAAFAALPAGTVDNLLKPENKAALTGVLTYHVVAGRVDAAALERAIRAGKGMATLRTVSGGTLMAMMNGPRNIVVKDAQGNVANVTTSSLLGCCCRRCDRQAAAPGAQSAFAAASATSWSCLPLPPLTPTAPTTTSPRFSGIPPAKIMTRPSFEACRP
jgi:uncharacterized surface protein with fasciclin (FAS1) repeats